MASELLLILPDFFPSDQRAPDEAALPRLPALETLLNRAQSQALSGGWRPWLAAHYATPELAALTPAAAAARAWLPAGGPAPESVAAAVRPTGYWLATPVHYFTGLDCVRLHPTGLLQLSAGEQSALIGDFQAEFADTGWDLHAIAGRELLLSGPTLEASGAEPAQFAGRDPSAGLPRGAQAATLRRLGVEIEMWLHEHRINQQRRAHGDLPVSTLWFWGAARGTDVHAVADRAIAPATPRNPDHLYGRDAYAQALWQLRGRPGEPLPSGFQELADRASSRHIVLIPTLLDEGLTAVLQRLEERWLAPALRALRSRELASIGLLAAARYYRLRRWQLARFWRARLPWWEQLT